MTTYSLGDERSQHALAAGLRARGYIIVEVEGLERDAYVTVSHGADEAGTLDEWVYAEVPSANIVKTAQSGEPTLAIGDQSLSEPGQPRHRTANA